MKSGKLVGTTVLGAWFYLALVAEMMEVQGDGKRS